VRKYVVTKASAMSACVRYKLEFFLMLFFEGVVFAGGGIGMAFVFSKVGGTVLQVGYECSGAD